MEIMKSTQPYKIIPIERYAYVMSHEDAKEGEYILHPSGKPIIYEEGKAIRTNRIIASNNPSLADKVLWPELPEREGIDVEAILGYENPYPLESVLQNLINAAEHLYHKKDYDGHDHEEIRICISRGKEIIGRLKVSAILELTKDKQYTKADMLAFSDYLIKRPSANFQERLDFIASLRPLPTSCFPEMVSSHSEEGYSYFGDHKSTLGEVEQFKIKTYKKFIPELNKEKECIKIAEFVW